MYSKKFKNILPKKTNLDLKNLGHIIYCIGTGEVERPLKGNKEILKDILENKFKSLHIFLLPEFICIIRILENDKIIHDLSDEVSLVW